VTRIEEETVADSPTASRHLSVKDVCAELGVARSTFYDWRAAKKAPPCIKLPNGDLRIRRVDFERWLESLEQSA
jgi:predicted DNA-binding transcriptional regulator AlpA